jgi:hypothetical protein
MGRWNIELIKQKTKELYNEEYTILTEIYNPNEDLLIQHNTEDPHIFNKSMRHFLQRGQTCKQCYGYKPKKINEVNTRIKNESIQNNEDFINKLKEIYSDEYTPLEKYTKYNEKILVRHNSENCNFYEWKVIPNDLLRGKNHCPICSKLNKCSKEHYQKKFDVQYGKDEFIILNRIKNSRLFKIQHKCSFIFEYNPARLLEKYKNRIYCPNCNPLQRTNYPRDLEKLANLINNVENNEYTLITKYIHQDINKQAKRTKLILEHDCGCQFEVEQERFFNKKDLCPNCHPNQFKNGRSNLEKEILDYIKSIYNKEIITSYRSILNNKQELDIYLPNDNTAFEINGLYWHSEEGSNGRCNQNYHLNKTEQCLKKNIILIHIFEDEWVNNKIIVKSKIKHILKLNNKPRIYARKCHIKEISTEMKNKFLNKYHLQGEDSSSIRLGLFSQERKLVAVMTFSKPRKSLGHINTNYDYELVRFASSYNFIIVGGFSKLLEYFKRNYDWKSIVTYADRRWSTGNLYEKCGFKLDHISKPNYWYFNGIIERKHRFNYRKTNLKKLFPEIYSDEKTEKEIMKEVNYFKIWDCGNLVYIYYK